ncbi:MAG: VanZ family protein [Lachnospiraceae bacterium]|nr:VanZ family protein [Lachnospiraceae bacterium]
MKISTFLKPFSFLPALALMYMIYTFSAQPGEASSALSYKVSEEIVKTVNTVTMQGWDDYTIQSYAGQTNGIVRKCAHVTEYFLLAIAVSFPLYVYGLRGILLMLLAGMICVGFACADEYHQSFVLGRASSKRDVIIDSIGVFFGVILTRLIGWSGRMAITGPVYERRQNRRQRELDAREEELERREEALRREEILRRRQSRPGDGYASRVRPSGMRPYPDQPSPDRSHQERTAQDRSHQGRAAQDRSYQERAAGVDDRTRVYGPVSDVDDRTRVFRTERQQQQHEEEYRRAAFERRKVQSADLQDDNTSDQLSEDIPFSGLFRRR